MTTPAALAASGSSFASPYSGSKLLDSGHALSQAVRNGDWLEGGLAFLDTLGNAAAALADPIGTLASIGLGWVMKYLKPLSTWLDQLAGSEANVAAVAQQWTNAGSALRDTGNTLVTRLSDLDGLSGDTVRTYVRFAQDTAKHIAATGDWADAAAGGLRSASSLVAKMQGVVKNAISQVVATAIEAMAVVAASFGLGIGYAIARVVTKVNQLVNKVVRPLTQVVRSVKSLVGLVQQLGSLFKSTERLSSSILGGGAKSTTVTAGSVVDASGATRLGNTAQANLISAGHKADNWHFESTPVVSTGIGAEGTLTIDGPMAGSAGVASFAGGGLAGSVSAADGAGSGAHGVYGSGAGAYGAGTGSASGPGSASSIVGTGAAASAATAASVGSSHAAAAGSRMMTPGAMMGGASRDGGARSGLGIRQVVREIVIEADAAEEELATAERD
ncbi:hypothetical protein [Microbacterium sp. Clip185]|uniref:hypothetical protein n=1 Tax=Microbacterium sp. Clip185 TaxID=3025663 RepID=UPI002365F091|nr:hypothetical protein [Microbacterium sp. Clip185]WDG18130.1 hypothetical protein PQV94_16115 [Microbacterium sp. Clip185]